MNKNIILYSWDLLLRKMEKLKNLLIWTVHICILHVCVYVCMYICIVMWTWKLTVHAWEKERNKKEERRKERSTSRTLYINQTQHITFLTIMSYFRANFSQCRVTVLAYKVYRYIHMCIVYIYTYICKYATICVCSSENERTGVIKRIW